MNITSLIAIYALFWVLSAFLVMPIGLRTHEDREENMAPGHADSAPTNFRPGLIAKRATVLSVLLCGIYYANYVNGWIGPEDLNFFGKPPNADGSKG